MSLVLTNPFRFGSGGPPEFASLYEAFNPLTTLAKSHFVEWFSGDALDTIWTQTNEATAPGTVGMADAIDGGFEMISATTAASGASWGFNAKKHYSPSGSNVICIMQNVDATTNQFLQSGFAETDAQSGSEDFFLYDCVSTLTNYVLLTGDGANSSTASDIAISTTAHVFSGGLPDATDSLMEIDGVLKVTKTTNHPDKRMQPIIRARNLSSSVARTFRWRYLEAYNI